MVFAGGACGNSGPAVCEPVVQRASFREGEAVAAAQRYGNEIAEKENIEAMEAIKKSGRSTIVVATDAENAAMRKAMEPIYDDMAKRVGKATIDEFVKEAAGATN